MLKHFFFGFLAFTLLSPEGRAKDDTVTWTVATGEPAENKEAHPFFAESDSLKLLEKIDNLEKRVAALEKKASLSHES